MVDEPKEASKEHPSESEKRKDKESDDQATAKDGKNTKSRMDSEKKKQQSADHAFFRLARNAVLAGVATLCAGVVVVVGTMRGLQSSEARLAIDAVFNLILLGLGCAIVAYALVEFIKRLSRGRAVFNRAQTIKTLEAITLEQHKEGPQQELWDSLLRASRLNTISFDARLEDVTAQLASRMAAYDPPDRVLPERLAVEREAFLDSLLVNAENRWRRWLRISSSVTAAVVASAAAAGTGKIFLALGALIFGAIIGGPISWLVRDLVRFVERRAGV